LLREVITAVYAKTDRGLVIVAQNLTERINVRMKFAAAPPDEK
jgi:hypothetical protein